MLDQLAAAYERHVTTTGETPHQIALRAGIPHQHLYHALGRLREQGYDPGIAKVQRLAKAVRCRIMVVPEALVPHVEVLLARDAEEDVTPDSPIGDLGLSARACVALHAHWPTVRALAAARPADILAVPGVSKGTLAEVRKALAAHGYALAGGAR